MYTCGDGFVLPQTTCFRVNMWITSYSTTFNDRHFSPWYACSPFWVQTIWSREVYSQIPSCFKVFEHQIQRILYSRLTRKSLLQIEQEKLALLAQLPLAVTRLRKLLLLSNTGRLRLEHVRIARKDFGLPDDFEFSVVLKFPKYFRLFEAKDTRNKYIGLLKETCH